MHQPNRTISFSWVEEKVEVSSWSSARIRKRAWHFPRSKFPPANIKARNRKSARHISLRKFPLVKTRKLRLLIPHSSLPENRQKWSSLCQGDTRVSKGTGSWLFVQSKRKGEVSLFWQEETSAKRYVTLFSWFSQSFRRKLQPFLRPTRNKCHVPFLWCESFEAYADNFFSPLVVKC